MEMSHGYKISIERDVATGFYKLPKSINTFSVVLEVFYEIKNLEDFTHFRRNFPPEWIYISAVKLKNISLWRDMFFWIFQYHEIYDRSFFKRMWEVQIQTKDDFLKNIESIYYSILNWWLDYDPELDMSVTFSKKDIAYVIKNYCSNSAIEICNSKLNIHPTERRWTINKVLFYRATKENKYTEKMFDDYMEWRNSKRLAQDFIKYFETMGINDISHN